MSTLLRSLWAEPAVERPTTAPWGDRALVLGLLPVAAAEALLRDDLPSRPLAVVLVVLTVLPLAWRRTHPFGAFLVAFGAAHLSTLVELALGLGEAGLYSSAAVLLLPYSLFRWGAGRQAVIGLGVMASAFGLAVLHGEMRGASDLIGGAVVLLFPAVLGASARFRAHARRRELEHAKLREREQLARELHDTVAHHVSAIAIQAQAGRAVGASRPEVAMRVLGAIEEEAGRALAELRTLVSALRDDEAALVPQARVADIPQLARAAGEGRAVEVELDGDLDTLGAPVQAALYRMAQESITNALRHARRARRIRVRVAAEGDRVRLTVRDDGEAPRARRASGHGIVGMTERAALLGGTLTAGPGDDGGWTVDAVLPREGKAR